MKLSEMRFRSQGKILVKAPIRGIAKVGRNNPCLCGSGLKMKKCCWKKITGNLGRTK